MMVPLFVLLRASSSAVMFASTRFWSGLTQTPLGKPLTLFNHFAAAVRAGGRPRTVPMDVAPTVDSVASLSLVMFRA